MKSIGVRSSISLDEMNSLGEFGKTAQSLARNPLGIIALFIVLLYGIAGIVLGASAAHLQPSERMPLIWFLALFPVLVLVVFAWLVSKHHQKLYAPSDFKSDDAFLQAISPERQRQRLEKEVAEVTASDDIRAIEQPLPLARQIESSRIRAEVVLAEDLVFRQLETEYSAPVRRNTSILARIATGREVRIPVDGLVVAKDKLLAVEVKLFRELTSKKNLRNRLNEVAGVAIQLGNANLPELSFLLAIVSPDLSADTRRLIEDEFHSLVDSGRLPVELRFFDLNDLKRHFGIIETHATSTSAVLVSPE